MDRFEVIPHHGIPPVEIGMSRAASREAMGLPVLSYQKGPETEPFTDTYLDGEFQVLFDANDRVEYIELSRLDGAIYKEVRVFETLAEEVLATIKADAPYDPNNPELGYSYIFPELELALWRPTMPEEGQDPDDDEGRYFATIGVGKRGYFSGQ